jgi:hypothetical protein
LTAKAAIKAELDEVIPGGLGLHFSFYQEQVEALTAVDDEEELKPMGRSGFPLNMAFESGFYERL